MTDQKETALVPVKKNSVVRTDTQENMQVTALTPLGMQECQEQLITWFGKKAEKVAEEANELQQNYEIAKKNKWKASTLKRHAALAIKRVDYYKKIKSALEEGYNIVPNMPLDIFAVRTDRKNPLKKASFYRWDGRQARGGFLPEGEGRYVNPDPTQSYYEVTVPNKKTGEDEEKEEWFADEFQDVEFPIHMAKPEIMEATSRAEAMNIFDEIGVLPARRKVDPLIMGRIRDPRSSIYHDKHISFIIAWYLDTSTV